MIALLAAVPLETELLRAELEVTTDGVWTGRIGASEVNLRHCGVGKANAAATATELILDSAPEAVILTGCGGAYPASGLRVGDLALAEEEIFGDEGSLTPQGFFDLEQLRLPCWQSGSQALYNRIPLDPALREQARPLLTELCAASGSAMASGPFVTVSTCSGTAAAGAELGARTDGLCENMEGAAVALVCHRHRIPLLEVRGISNLVEDRDVSRWELPVAAARAQQGVLRLLRHWPRKAAR